MEKTIPCRFFLRDGYCAKGKYCSFLHQTQTERPVCKFFLSSEGCRRGDSCTFSHRVVKEKKQTRPPQNMTANSVPSLPQPPPQPVKLSENPVNELWGFESQADEHYFYGTAGAMNTSRPYPRQYADAVGSCESSESNIPQQPILKSHISPVVCPFFIYGSCMYGTNCKNIHSLDGVLEQNEFENIQMSEEIEAARRAECGICLCPIDDKSLGMLSNCWCTFCLECIRSWRKEGGTFSKASHVRLCPLCRTDSYFIIPCNRLIRDVERKTQLVEEYKKSLSRIPCRHYQTNSCPFGISCFYKHISPDGTVEVTAPPRILITADETVRLTSTTLLADYVTSSTR